MSSRLIAIAAAALASGVLVGSPDVHAAPLLSDDFEAVTPPAAPSSSTWGTLSSITTGRDATTFPAAGTTTYVILDGNEHLGAALSPSSLSTVSFDFVDNPPVGTDDGVHFGWGVTTGDFNDATRSAIGV